MRTDTAIMGNTFSLPAGPGALEIQLKNVPMLDGEFTYCIGVRLHDLGDRSHYRSLRLRGGRHRRLLSPGGATSCDRRERSTRPSPAKGAFLANNLLFAAFAFVVLHRVPVAGRSHQRSTHLGGQPVFGRSDHAAGRGPAVLDGRRPWRKRRPNCAPPDRVAARRRHRRGLGHLGVRGSNPPLVFGLAPSPPGRPAAATGAGHRRQGARAARAGQWRHDRSHRGVDVPAVAASPPATPSPTAVRSLCARASQPAWGGHTVTYLGTVTVNHPNRQATEAGELKVDGGKSLPAGDQPVRRRQHPGRHAIGEVHTGERPLPDPRRRASTPG